MIDAPTLTGQDILRLLGSDSNLSGSNRMGCMVEVVGIEPTSGLRRFGFLARRIVFTPN